MKAEVEIRHKLQDSLVKATSTDADILLSRVNQVQYGSLFTEAFMENTDPDSWLIRLAEPDKGSHLVGKLKTTFEGYMHLATNQLATAFLTPLNPDLYLVAYLGGIDTIPAEDWGNLRADPIIQIISRIRNYHMDKMYPRLGDDPMKFYEERLLLMRFPGEGRLITPSLAWATDFAADFNKKASLVFPPK